MAHYLFQTGILTSLMQGVYQGDMDFAALMKQGDFGLGTPDNVNGEIIALDGIYYCVDGKQQTCRVAPHTKTPFSVVTHFTPSLHFTAENISSIQQLEQLLDNHLENKNIFYAIRIDAEFSDIHLRSEKCHPTLHTPLSQAMPMIQKTFKLKQIAGTLVIIYTPPYAAAINVPGYHTHFINTEKTTGGHVFKLALKTGCIAIQPLYHLHVSLINNAAFARADLTSDVRAAAKAVEQDR